jgi:hypothetical protein
MDPPAYTPRRTIGDLRHQIIANASVLRPRSNDERSRADHVEVIIAKWPSDDLTFSFPSEKASAAGSSSRPNANKHYALLIKRTLSNTKVEIIVRGAPRDTIEEALEVVLEETERAMHAHVLKYGKLAPNDGCLVM